MSEHEDYFECRDCKYEYRCPIHPDSSTCCMFTSKQKVRFPIEDRLFTKIASLESCESITFSVKEKIILLEVLYKDILKEFKKENKNGNRS